MDKTRIVRKLIVIMSNHWEVLGLTPGGTTFHLALCRFKGLRTVTAQIVPLIRGDYNRSSDHTRSLVHQTSPLL